jgi:sulfonate transport system substrate-binding protein
LLEALNIGAIDTGYGGDAAFVFAVGAGAAVKAIGAQKHTGVGPVVVVRSDSQVQSLDQLAGLKIATPRGSIAHNLVLAALEAAGKPLDAVQFAFLSPNDGEAALRGRSVDAWAIWDPNASVAAKQGARILPGGEGWCRPIRWNLPATGRLPKSATCSRISATGFMPGGNGPPNMARNTPN